MDTTVHCETAVVEPAVDWGLVQWYIIKGYIVKIFIVKRSWSWAFVSYQDLVKTELGIVKNAFICHNDEMETFRNFRLWIIVFTNLVWNYIDKLIKMLRRSGLGCTIGSFYYGIMVYADDIILLCPIRSWSVRSRI